MSKKFKHLLLIVLCILNFSCQLNGQEKEQTQAGELSGQVRDSIYKAKYFIIVVVDGPRYSETWGDTAHTYIPFMSKYLSKEGIVFTNFYNDGYTYTNSGHTALTTGYRQKINNSGEKDYPIYPSIFQYFLKESKQDKNSAWIITSKDKLEILANTKHKEWNNKFIPSSNCGKNGIGSGYRKDAVTFNATLETLKTHHPKLVLINFKEPDGAGHANNWPEYLKGIKDTDKYVYDLWNFIQNDSIYKDQTAFFVTNDHGRHLDHVADGFVSHGCSCNGCRHINLFVAGPDFKKNVIINDTYAQQDIPATIAKMLGLEMPYSEGKIIEVLFKD